MSTGPYGIVRHPLYTTLLGQLALLSLAYWSWVPLASLGVCAAAFAYKMTIEVSFAIFRAAAALIDLITRRS